MSAEPMSAAAKIRWALWLLLVLLLVIVAFQNLEVVQVRLLFWDARVTTALLLAGTAFIGFLMGLSARTLWHMRSSRKRGKISKSQDAA